MSKRKRRLPGYRWRVLAHHDLESYAFDHRFDGVEDMCFDELVVDGWFHIEQMDTRHWWIGLGGLMINVYVPPPDTRGKPSVLIELDDPSRLSELRNFAPRHLPDTHPSHEKEEQ